MGRVSKRFSLYLMETRLWQGPFARPALPGVVTTMAPSESRHGRMAVMVSRRPLASRHTPPTGRPAGPPKFLSALSTPAVPYHPGPPDGCTYLLLRRQFQASPSLAGWPRPKKLNEAETGSLALRLTSSSKRGFTEPVTRTRCPPDYTVNRLLPWSAPFI